MASIILQTETLEYLQKLPRVPNPSSPQAQSAAEQRAPVRFMLGRMKTILCTPYVLKPQVAAQSDDAALL